MNQPHNNNVQFIAIIITAQNTILIMNECVNLILKLIVRFE